MIDLANGQLDRYQLRERLGSGGMARVYKAWDTNLERLVAIKILHEHLADDPTFKERFEREAKFIASFNHPNIVQLYDYKVSQREGVPLYYMVMSYMPGRHWAITSAASPLVVSACRVSGCCGLSPTLPMP